MTRFKGEILRAADLPISEHPGVVRDYEFIDCTITGPAIVGPMGVVFDHCRFDYDPDLDSIIWPIPLTREKVVGSIPLVNCVFRRCHFMRIGFCMSETEVAAFKASIRGGAN